jgi:hypothetical protein
LEVPYSMLNPLSSAGRLLHCSVTYSVVKRLQEFTCPKNCTVFTLFVEY